MSFRHYLEMEYQNITNLLDNMLESNLCDYSDAYIVLKGTITVRRPNNKVYDKKLAFKDNAPFISCI